MINNFDCDVTSCNRAVRIEVGTSHSVILFPNGTALHNGHHVIIPVTLSRTLTLSSTGAYTIVQFSSSKWPFRKFSAQQIETKIAVNEEVISDTDCNCKVSVQLPPKCVVVSENASKFSLKWWINTK